MTRIAGGHPDAILLWLTVAESAYLGMPPSNCELGRLILDAVGTTALPTSDEVYGHLNPVSSGDLRLLGLISEGETFEEAGLEQGVVPVGTFVERLGRNLGVHATAYVVRRAVELDLLSELPAQHFLRLSPTETLTLGLISRGWHNRQIADRFGRNEGTINQNASEVYRKLNASGPFQAVRAGLSVGALLPDHRILGVKQPHVSIIRPRRAPR